MKRTITRTVVLAAALVFSVPLMTMRAQLADDFVGDLARGNMAEISLSQMALQRSQNESVKQFAQMMVTDHTAAGTELQTLATSKNITLPTAIDQKHQSAMTKLGGESGTNFDRDYMKQMVSDHEKTLNLLQKQADKGTDADIKAFAAKMVPIVQGHLTAARNLSATLGNNTGNSTAMSSANNGMNATRNSNSNTRKSGNSNRKTNSNNGNMNGNSNGNSNRE